LSAAPLTQQLVLTHLSQSEPAWRILAVALSVVVATLTVVAGVLGGELAPAVVSAAVLAIGGLGALRRLSGRAA